MSNKIIIFCLFFIISGCTIKSDPLTVNQRYDQAVKNVKEIFKDQTPASQHLDFYQALMRSMKYNLDYRIKLVNTALQTGQLEIATYTLFPVVNASGSVYSRNNDLSSAGITGDGVTTGLSSSTPRTLRSARLGATWNILDFGMGYVRAKQQSEKVLIAEEEARRQLQRLAQDVLVAYWTAYSAQQLITDTIEFQKVLTRSKGKLAQAVHDNSVPKETLLNYQSALLDGSRRMIQLQYKYDKAMADLKHLLFLPVDQTFILAPPPEVYMQAQDVSSLNFQKMDAVTLVNHPELRGQNYMERIAKFGVKTVLLQALPGITLNAGLNYNSNQFLLNNKWIDKELDIAWNLLNLASLPASYKSAEMQVKYEELKSMALTMTALVETRYAFYRYSTLRNEFLVAHKQSINAKDLYRLNKNRQLASLASDQQVIMAQLRSITATMDENLLLSDLSIALGQLYLSVGVDILPVEAMNQPLDQAVETLKNHYKKNSTTNFTLFINKTHDKLFGHESVHTSQLQDSLPYTVQLYGSYELKDVQEIEKELPIKKDIHIAKTKLKGRDWYVLTYGKFKSPAKAKDTGKELAKRVKEFAPWVRKTENLNWISLNKLSNSVTASSNYVG